MGLGLGHAQEVGTLVDVVGAAEQHVDLLEGHHLGLGDEEVDVGSEDKVDGHEEEETLEAGVCSRSLEYVFFCLFRFV